MRTNNEFKSTSLGNLPADWDIKEIGELNFDISDGNYSSRYPKSKDFHKRGVPFIRANNIKNMRVIDSDMRFISESLHSELTSGHIKKDDILITTRGDIGNIAFVPDRHIGSNINAQIVRINTNGIINHIFLGYFLSHSSIQKLIQGAETGSALKQLPKGRLSKLPVALPPLPEQQAIAEVLSNVDALIEAQEALIEKKRLIKQGVMQELLTGKRRLPGFSGEWEKLKLSEILDYEQPGDYKISIDKPKSKGLIPVLTPGKTFILGYTDDDNGIYDNLPVILFDDFTTASKYVDFPFKVDSSAVKFLTTKSSNFDLLFIYEKMQIIKFEVGNHKRYYISEYQQLLINVPDITEQKAISEISKDMDKEIEALEESLQKYRLIKQGMMQELLTGRSRLV